LDSGTSCGFSTPLGSLVSTNPQLGPLQSNGGPTQTMALPLQSAAVDAIPAALNGCTGSSDQRGVARPQGAGCDIGAFELAQSSTVSATTGAASIAYIRSATFATGSRNPATTLALTGRVGAGDLLTGWFGQWDAAGQVQVSDSLNGPWARVQGMTYNTGTGDIALYYLANSKASLTGLTITISASASTYLAGTVGEYSGAAVASPLDQFAMRSGSGTSVDSGPSGAVPAGELIFGALTANN